MPLQAPRTLTSCKSTTWCAQACAHMQTCTQAAPWQMHMIRCSNRKRYIPASHKSFFFWSEDDYKQSVQQTRVVLVGELRQLPLVLS